jgi:hypothetical protein
MVSEARWAEVEAAIHPLRRSVLGHRLYSSLQDRRAVQVFMDHHVWAVWDFMSVLTRLQTDLTCVALPWVPSDADAAARRLVNEIKLGEESDEHPNGGWTSHFELYVQAMEEVGANTDPVLEVMAVLNSQGEARSSTDVAALARECGAPPGAGDFVASTFDLVTRGSTLEVAAAFALGRERLIPEMFGRLVDGDGEGRLLAEYLRRHIELDEGEHGPLANRLVEELAGEDPAAWRAVEGAAAESIGSRLQLWDAVVAELEMASMAR